MISPAFVRSCTITGQHIPMKYPAVCHAACAPRSSRQVRRLASRQLAHPLRETSSSRKQEWRLTPLDKRRKQYFFKLLSAARNRDKRLLVAVVKALGKDTELLRMQGVAGIKDHMHFQDVLLKAASRCGETALADKLFQDMIRKGQCPTRHTAGAFLDALKLDGQARRCVTVFREMMDKGADLGEVCFNIVLSSLVQGGDFAEGIDMLEQASTRWGIAPGAYTFNVFYSAASRQDTAAGQTAVAKAQELMSRWGVAPDRVTINTLIDQAIKHGRLEEAIKIFERVLRGGFCGVVPDVITFNVGICAYMAQLSHIRAFELLDEMDRRGVLPRADTFNSLLTGLTKMGDTQRVIEVFNKYVRCGDAGNGSSVTPTLITYNLILQALCLEKDANEARIVYAEMRQRKIRPDNITLTALVRLRGNRDDIYDVIETARRLRIRPSLTFLNSCIRALGDHDDVHGACQVMDRIKALENMEPDTISYNSLMYALVQTPWVDEVLTSAGGWGDSPAHGTKRLSASPLRLVDEPFPARVSGQGPQSSRGEDEAGGCPEVSGSPNRFNGLTGAEAALLLMAEMRAGDSSAAPDVVTYTTVLSGVVRAEDARMSERGTTKLWRTRQGDFGSKGQEHEGHTYVSSTEMCQQLYAEAVESGVEINGKVCNAVLLGFGADLTGAIAFWKQHVRPALIPKGEGVVTDIPSVRAVQSTANGRMDDLFSAYCGLLHVCGRAGRPDAAVKVVFASRKEGVTPSSTMSNTYFKAKQDIRNVEDDSNAGRAPFRVMRLLHRQMENALEVECGISKHSDPVDVPIERIRIRF